PFVKAELIDVSPVAQQGNTNLNTSAYFAFESLAFSDDGLSFYISDFATVKRYTLSSPFNVESTFFNTGENLMINSTDSFSRSFYISPNGLNIYTGLDNETSGLTGGAILHYRLTNAYNLSSAVFVDRFDTGEWYPAGIYITDDGKNMTISSVFFSGGDTKAHLLSYNLVTDYNFLVSTKTGDFNTQLINNENAVGQIDYISTGNKYFGIGQGQPHGSFQGVFEFNTTSNYN